jgi:hypothetical protein
MYLASYPSCFKSILLCAYTFFLESQAPMVFQHLQACTNWSPNLSTDTRWVVLSHIHQDLAYHLSLTKGCSPAG